MRIRSIKPEYWNDPRLHNSPGITADVREFYIGLWGLSDDIGWLRWDVSQIGSELYSYRSVKVRERQVEEWGQRLANIGRIRIDPCGHAFIPKLTSHQRIGGTKSQTAWLQHQKCLSPQSSAEFREPPQGSGAEGEVRGGEVKEGKGSGGTKNLRSWTDGDLEAAYLRNQVIVDKVDADPKARQIAERFVQDVLAELHRRGNGQQPQLRVVESA